MVKKSIICCVSALLLTGCAMTQSEQSDSTTYTMDKTAQIKLAQAATSVSQSLQELAAIDSATHPGTKLPPPPNPGEFHMTEIASIDWTGPITPIMQKIAKASYYRLRILGKRPTNPIIISLTAKNTPLVDILRDVSYQAEKSATITVYPNQRTIELRYR